MYKKSSSHSLVTHLFANGHQHYLLRPPRKRELVVSIGKQRVFFINIISKIKLGYKINQREYVTKFSFAQLC